MKRFRYMPSAHALLAVDPKALGAEFDVFGFLVGPTSAPFALDGDVAVVTIRGPLAHHEDWCCDSYDSILDRVRAALASAAKVVVLRIDSPGGDAIGCFEASAALRSAAASAGKKLVAYAEGTAASAAYALACGCSAIYVPAAGFVGSVGVLQPMVDATAQDAALGVKFEWITSGVRKLDGNPHTKITDDARAAVQGRVYSLADLFFALVAGARGVSPEAVRGLNGEVLHGQAAVAARLADAVINWTELLAMVAKGEAPTATTSKATTETDMDKKAMRAWLAKKAEAGDEDAKAALKCFDAEFPPEKDEKKGGGEEKKDAKAEEPPPSEKKEEKKDDADAKALFALAKEVQTLKAEQAADKEAKARAELVAKRPDFSKEQLATLAKLPLAMVKEAVETWPKIVGLVSAEHEVQGTRGDSQTGGGEARPPRLPPKESSELRQRMGLEQPVSKIVRQGNTMTFPVISPEAAAAASKKAVA